MRNQGQHLGRPGYEILTVIRLGLPQELQRSLACTNIIENALGTVRLVSRNVKLWRNAEMALRWTATGLREAQKTFRRLKAYQQLPILRIALRELIPTGINQNPCAHFRRPIDMIFHG